MNYPLLLNALVSLIVGGALVLVWRRNPLQTFTRYLGWSYLVQLLSPASYWLTLHGHPTLRLVRRVGWPGVPSAYSSRMVKGASQLADRPVRTSAMVVFVAASLAINVGTAIGLLCCYWLWFAGTRNRGPSRMTGILITALGLNQFTFVLLGNDGEALQASTATLIGVALGLVLIDAALQRSAQKTVRLRERFERRTNRSHQGIILRQKERIAYANPAALTILGASGKDDLSVLMVARSIPRPERESMAVVRAICQLAQALHLHVVAEGVETTAQAEAARDAGCDELQGYLYARPLSPEDAGQWLAQHTEHQTVIT